VLSFGGAVERDAGPAIGQAAITSGPFRTPQSVGIIMTTTTTAAAVGMVLLLLLLLLLLQLQLLLVVIVRFLGTAQPVEMETVMSVTAGRFLNVKKLGRTRRQTTMIPMHGRHVLHHIVDSHSLQNLFFFFMNKFQKEKHINELFFFFCG
jgi:hypothetical protein